MQPVNFRIIVMTRDAEIINAIRGSDEPLRREFALVSRGVIDRESRTAEFSLSSETQVERYFGIEVLDHSPSSIRLDRFQGGAAWLVNHDTNDQVGRIVQSEVKAKRLRVTVKFSRSPRGEEIFQDIEDEIRVLVSVGYRIHEVKATKQKGGVELVRVVDWEPYEGSTVAIPADASVGFGRSLQNQNAIDLARQKANSINQAICQKTIRMALPPHLQVVRLRR